MADPLHELLKPYLSAEQDSRLKTLLVTSTKNDLDVLTPATEKYLSRLLSLSRADLTSTEPLSLKQASQSDLLSLQALSSRSHRAVTSSYTHLSTLKDSLPSLNQSLKDVRDAIPQLDASAVHFATSYSRSREADSVVLAKRKSAMMLARQSDKLQDILDLPELLSAAIVSASTSSGAGGGAGNYSQALDLFAHIKRLQILYPDSELGKEVLRNAEQAMGDMTTNLVSGLRGQNIRLAAAIRTVGWLKRVTPQLTSRTSRSDGRENLSSIPVSGGVVDRTAGHNDEAGDHSFEALFLCARLCTFLTTIEALAPLRDLADQETEKRVAHENTNTSANTSLSTSSPAERRPSSAPTHHQAYGPQTERYLKRYIEVFREHSFASISLCRNMFPPLANAPNSATEADSLRLPSALASFPLHLVDIFVETLQTYLPNITDHAARESLLMQVLYAANSLGRLGADFSMMISLLGMPEVERRGGTEPTHTAHQDATAATVAEPEWAKVIKKHRVQAARLDALAAGQDQAASRRGSHDIPVR